MFRIKSLAATAIAGLLATSAFAAVDKIAVIEVTADLSAIQNEQAATFWADLEADLENAIAARVTDRLVPEGEVRPDENRRIDGAQIEIEISAVELANAFERELNLADAVLVGDVEIIDDMENSNADTYQLSVSLESAQVAVPDGATLVLSTDTTEAYTQLVEAFAEGVVTRLK